MKILVLSQYFWPENFTINQLSKTLSSKGNDVEVLTGKPNYPDGKIYNGYKIFRNFNTKWDDLKVFRLPIIPRRKATSLNLFVNYLSFVFSGLAIMPFFAWKKKYDVILVYAPSPITQAIPAIFLGFLTKAPVILWTQDLWPESIIATNHIKSSFIIKSIVIIVKFIYSKVDLVLVPSKGFIKPVSKYIALNQIVYYPNSVNNIFNKKIISTNKEKHGVFNILFAGNIGVAQSIETIIKSAILLTTHPYIQFTIVGSGSKKKWLKSQIKKYRLKNIKVMDQKLEEKMPDLMNKASALLITLKADPVFKLTIPNKLQSYLAVGKPIIGSLEGYAANIINESGAGLICKPEDSVGLSKVILDLSSQTDAKLSQMSKNGRRYFKKHFDHDMLADKLILIMSQLVK